MLRETDFDKQRALMRQYETHIIDTEAHEFPMLWWYRIIPERSYVHGWKIGPSHYHQPGSVQYLAGWGAERVG